MFCFTGSEAEKVICTQFGVFGREKKEWAACFHHLACLIAVTCMRTSENLATMHSSKEGLRTSIGSFSEQLSYIQCAR
jgi:hypothetical protein